MSDASGELRSVGKTALRGVVQVLWCLVPVASLGILMWVPAAQAWWRARTVVWAVVAALLGVGGALMILGYSDVIDDNSAFLGLILIVGSISGSVAAVHARHVVFADKRPRLDPEVQAMLDQRERREAARQMVEQDPGMAVELGIGRPELGTRYDDGGLVDLNNASSVAIASRLDWDYERAESFVDARDRDTAMTPWPN